MEYKISNRLKLVALVLVIIGALGVGYGFYSASQVTEDNIAEYMHDKTCKSSHEDQCDWLYDKGDWSMHSRKHYLEKAKNALKLVDAKTIIAILKIAY